MDTYFDKIYIINLKESTDRKKTIDEQMVKFGITNYVFEQAISGKDINLDEFKNNNLWAYPGNSICNINCSCTGKGHELHINQIALHSSHYNIWKDIIKNDYNKCLILEDDCIFTENINFFEKIICDIPETWKM